MGGRGAASGAKGGAKILPNARKAVIARDKLKNYLLNPSKSPDKAKFFRSLGYNMRSFRRFEADIREEIKTAPAVATIINKYGHTVTAYSVTMPLGINKKAMVVTGWQRDGGASAPRFITAYPDK